MNQGSKTFLSLSSFSVLTAFQSTIPPLSTVSAYLPFFLQRGTHLFFQPGLMCCLYIVSSKCSVPGTVEPWVEEVLLESKERVFFIKADNFVQILLLSEIVVFIFFCAGTSSVSSGSLVYYWNIETS